MSFEQAKLKAIWQNPCLTSICSLMPTSSILQSNISAAMNEQPLNAEINKSLTDYANNTKAFFCGRCAICETANADKIPIFDLMDMLMYSRGYDGKDWVANLIANRFAQIPAEIRNKISNSDYSKAEKICPHKMPIAQLMKEASKEFSI